MSIPQYPHIFVPQAPDVSAYKAPQSGGGRKMRLPDRDHASHGAKLLQQLNKAW
jgi:Subtilase family